MSLINDALKRASQTALTPHLPKPARARQPERSSHSASRESRNFAMVVLLPLGLVLVLGAAGWLFLKDWDPSTGLTFSGNKMRASARQRPVTSPAEEQGTAAQSRENPPQRGQARVVSPGAIGTEAKSGSAPQTAIAAPQTAAMPPQPLPTPAYKLQGIFYRPSRPSAMINGRTVVSGQKIGDAQVGLIERDRVTIQIGEETKVLTLLQNN